MRYTENDMTSPNDGSQKYQPVNEDTCRHIAEDKSKIAIADHERNCPAIVRLEKRLEHAENRMDRVENLQADHSKAIAKFIGERDFKRWLLPILTSVFASSMAAFLMNMALKH